MLGAELDGRIRRQEGQRQGELDVEVLLRGAEKLGEVVYVQGLTERCREARERYRRVERSLEWYEERVVEQGMRIERLNREGASARGRTDEEGDTEMGDGEGGEYEEDGEGAVDVDELIRLEEEEIRALEARKRELEERVSGMERDLGGLMR